MLSYVRRGWKVGDWPLSSRTLAVIVSLRSCEDCSSVAFETSINRYVMADQNEIMTLVSLSMVGSGGKLLSRTRSETERKMR